MMTEQVFSRLVSWPPGGWEWGYSAQPLSPISAPDDPSAQLNTNAIKLPWDCNVAAADSSAGMEAPGADECQGIANAPSHRHDCEQFYHKSRSVRSLCFSSSGWQPFPPVGRTKSHPQHVPTILQRRPWIPATSTCYNRHT